MHASKDLSQFNAGTVLSLLGRNPSKQEGFLNPSLYKGSTVIHPNLESLENLGGRFWYGTAGSPTIANLEDSWTELTGAAGTVLSPTGLGSISLAILSVVKHGVHILLPISVYGPTANFCNNVLRKFGVNSEFYDPLIGKDIEELIKTNTSLIFLESPCSQTMEIQDVPAIVKVAKKHNVKTVLDNTWATPLFFKAHDYGIDISVEAGTKYVGGHSDLLLGLTSANSRCWPALRSTYDAMGMLPGADDCHLALRGLRTLQLRVKEAERKALILAEWLEARNEVERILHPAFEDCPGHSLWVRDYSGSTGVFTFILKDQFSRAGLKDMLEKMQIFKLGYSWGGYESLLIPVNSTSRDRIRTWSHFGYALRIQVGLEDIDDQLRDLEMGFERLKSHVSDVLQARL